MRNLLVLAVSTEDCALFEILRIRHSLVLTGLTSLYHACFEPHSPAHCILSTRAILFNHTILEAIRFLALIITIFAMVPFELIRVLTLPPESVCQSNPRPFSRPCHPSLSYFSRAIQDMEHI